MSRDGGALGIENKVIQAIEDLALRSRIGPAQAWPGKEPRAAKIAELVLWIGWLRWTIRNGGRDRGTDLGRAPTSTSIGLAATTQCWQDQAAPAGFRTILANRIGLKYSSLVTSPSSAAPISGVISAANMQRRCGKRTQIPLSADFVMQWWDRYDILHDVRTRLRRFGFVTTNSITQVFSRRVIERHLDKSHLLLACPDHP